MATLISGATGNFTSSGTWFSCDATSELHSEAGTSGVTSTATNSSNFTPGAIMINAIAVKVSSRSASPSGTFTIVLRNTTLNADVANTTVTVNVSDLPLNGGWVVFPTTGSVLLIIATNYAVRCSTSAASGQVTLYRDGTANNWTRELRTTTAATPGSGDVLIIAGELTGAGTGNSYTVTMNETATTSYGSTTPPDGISVNIRGTLTYGTSASTNYYLKYKGRFSIWDSGTMNMGTSGTPMPSTSTAILEMDSASNVDTGLVVQNGGTLTTYGNALTYDRALLASDASAAATSLTSSVSTGWLNGDEIGIASTSTTFTECEKKSLTANASGTTLTIAAITYAHSGTSPTQGELINLTRNVKIRGIGTNAPSTSTTLQGYIYYSSDSIVNHSWTEIYQMGSATTNKRGIDLTTTTGTFSMNRCSVHDFYISSSVGLNIATSATAFTITDNVQYNLHSSHVQILGATSNTPTMTGNIYMLMGTAATMVQLGDIGLNFSNNTVVGGGNAILANEANANLGTFSGNTCHSNSSSGLIFNQNVTGGTIESFTSWRNANNGTNTNSRVHNVTYSNCNLFGNPAAGMLATNSTVTLINCSINGGASFVQLIGILTTGSIVDIINSSIGVSSAHSTADIQPNFGAVICNLRNSSLGSSTDVRVTNLYGKSYVGSEKHNQTAGNHKSWFQNGIVSIDTTIYNNASPSARLTPNTASAKLELPYIRTSVTNGNTATVSVYVRKSVVGDGTAYNGNQPRLIVKENYAMGINSDTVLATASGAAGSWELLTGTTSAVTDDGTLEIAIDCDGTTGWINVDDFKGKQSDTSSFKYWLNGQPRVTARYAPTVAYASVR